MALEAAREYQSSLEELTFNSKLHINVLTMLAEENVNYAENIVQVIEKHIHQASAERKLPTLYLMDSILKNLRNSPYTHIFAQNIVTTFVAVFEKVDEKKRQSMYKLRQTWSDIFSNSKLYAIDVRINSIDPAWPITAQPPDSGISSIHVNPKFLNQQQQQDENLKMKEAEEQAKRLQELEDQKLRQELEEEERRLKAEEELKRKKEEEERKRWEEEQERKMREELLAKQQELMRLQQQRLELELEETRRALLEKEKQLQIKEKEEKSISENVDKQRQEKKRKEEEMRLRAEMELRKNLELEIRRKTENEIRRKAEAEKKKKSLDQQSKMESSSKKDNKQNRDPRMKGQVKQMASSGKSPGTFKESKRSISPEKKVDNKKKDEKKVAEPKISDTVKERKVQSAKITEKEVPIEPSCLDQKSQIPPENSDNEKEMPITRSMSAVKKTSEAKGDKPERDSESPLISEIVTSKEKRSSHDVRESHMLTRSRAHGNKDDRKGRDYHDIARAREPKDSDNRDFRDSDGSSTRGKNNEKEFRDSEYRGSRNRRERDWLSSRSRNRESRSYRAGNSPLRESTSRSQKFKERDRDMPRNSRNYRGHRQSKSPSSEDEQEEMLALRPKRYSPNRTRGSLKSQRRSRSSKSPERLSSKKSKSDQFDADDRRKSRGEERNFEGETRKSSTPKRSADDQQSDEDLQTIAPPAKKAKDSETSVPAGLPNKGGLSSDIAELFGTEDVDYRHMKLPAIPRKPLLNDTSEFSSPQQKGWAKFKENRPSEFPFQQPRRLSVDINFRSPVVKQMSTPGLTSPPFVKLEPSPIISASDIENILQQADTQLIRGRMSYNQYEELQKQLKELQRLQIMMAEVKSSQKAMDFSLRSPLGNAGDRMHNMPHMEPPPRPFPLDGRERPLVSPPFNSTVTSQVKEQTSQVPALQPPPKPALLESPKKGLLEAPPSGIKEVLHEKTESKVGLLETPGKPILLDQSGSLSGDRKALLETPEKPALLDSPRKTLLGNSPNETSSNRSTSSNINLPYEENLDMQNENYPKQPSQNNNVEDAPVPSTSQRRDVLPIPPPPIPPNLKTKKDAVKETGMSRFKSHEKQDTAHQRFMDGNKANKIISIFDLNVEKPKNLSCSQDFKKPLDTTSKQEKYQRSNRPEEEPSSRRRNEIHEDVPIYDTDKYYVPEYDPRWVTRNRHYREDMMWNSYELVINGTRCYHMKIGGAPKLISFSAEHKKKVYIDPKTKEVMINQTCYTRVGAAERTIVIGGKKYHICVQGQLKRFWIDGHQYELRIDASAQLVNIAGNHHEMKLESKSRQVFLDRQVLCRIEMYNDMYKVFNVEINGEEHNLQFYPPPRKILIDGQLCELNLSKKFPTIMVNGERHGIRFNGNPRTLIMDGKHLIVGMDKPTIVKIGGVGKPLTVSFGGPGHEVIIDEYWYEVKFNGPPVLVHIANRTLELQIPGPPPDVKILGVVKTLDDINQMFDGEENYYQSSEQRDPDFRHASKDFRNEDRTASNFRTGGPTGYNMPPRPTLLHPRFGGQSIRPMMERPPMGPMINRPQMPIMNRPPVGPRLVDMSNTATLMGQSITPAAMPMEGLPVQSGLQPMAQAAQPQAPIMPQLDVGDLFSKLVSAGIIHRRKSAERSNSPMPPTVQPAVHSDSPVPMDTSSQEVKPTPSSASQEIKVPETDKPVKVQEDVPDLTDLVNDKLKKPYNGIFSKLYCGIQCNSCGTRFKDDKTDKYKEHLDWHFRQNKREKEDSRVVRNRRWYYSINDWVQFEEIGDLEERFVSNYFENMLQSIHQAIGGSDAPTIDSTAETCPVASSKDEENVCVICGDPFEQFYDDEEEEWHLRDAIRMNNKTYHPVCYEDAKDDINTSSLLETPSPEAQEVKELPDPINNPLAYLSALSQQAKETNQSLDEVAKKQIKTEPIVSVEKKPGTSQGTSIKTVNPSSSISSMFNIINNPPSMKVKTEPKEDKTVVHASVPIKSEHTNKKEVVAVKIRKDPRLAAKVTIKNDPRTVIKNEKSETDENADSQKAVDSEESENKGKVDSSDVGITESAVSDSGKDKEESNIVSKEAENDSKTKDIAELNKEEVMDVDKNVEHPAKEMKEIASETSS